MKDLFKERKHVRSESVGSTARWRDSSHHHCGDIYRWVSAEFRRPPGQGRQGGWHLFSEESGHGCAISRSSAKKSEDDSGSSVSRGEKYGRSGRDNRGSAQRDCRGHPWETTNGSLNLSRRRQGVNNGQRSVDGALAYSYHQRSDFANTWDPHHLKVQRDKMGGVNRVGLVPRCDRQSSLGSIGWKPLKWTHAGSLSSRGSGFGHSSNFRSMGGAADSNEAKAELIRKSETTDESLSGEAVECTTSSVSSEDTTSRKKQRLNWGEGLAKYEKKKVEVPDVIVYKYGPVLSTASMEPCTSLAPSIVDKSLKVTGFSDCACHATPSSVACSSASGVEEKLFGKTANMDNDESNMIGSQDLVQRFSFNLEQFDMDCLNNLSFSIFDLIQSDDRSSVESGFVRSTAMNKLLIWKADISKVLETTESEINFLENELKSLRSESGGRCSYPSPTTLGSRLICNNEKSCEEPVVFSDKVTWPEPLKIVSSNVLSVEKMSLSANLLSIHENGKEEDDGSPGTSTSKFVEPLSLVKSVSPCDTWKYDGFPENLNVVELTSTRLSRICLCWW